MVRNKINEVGTDLSSRSQREEVGPCTHMSDTPISKVIYTWYCSIGPLPKLECPCCLVVKSCQTPFWTHGLSMGFSRQEYSSGLPFPSPGDSQEPRNQAHGSCCVSCNAGRFFTVEPPGETKKKKKKKRIRTLWTREPHTSHVVCKLIRSNPNAHLQKLNLQALSCETFPILTSTPTDQTIYNK